MDEVRLNTPAIVKLGSFAGKIKYCLVDTFATVLIKNYKLKIKLIDNQLIVMIDNGTNEMPLHVLIWKYIYRSILPQNVLISHRNGITMDNRLENLFLTFTPIYSSLLIRTSTFYWRIIANLPIDMDEINYHQSDSIQSSLYECHYSPCTQLLNDSSYEQFSCFQCRKIKYCSHFCQAMDMDIHSIFCNPCI